MAIEFDLDKNLANRKKHGIDLADAATVLDDPFVLTIENGTAQGEQRHVSLGYDAIGRALVVVWTDRDGDIRLISARKASRGETRHYRGRL